MTSFQLPKYTLLALPAAPLLLLLFTIQDQKHVQLWFVHGTYYFLLTTVLCWAGTALVALRGVGRADLIAWVKDNWPGVVLAVVVTVVAGLAIDPAFRLLSDEANLVGTSKNLFTDKTATFPVSGKNYYGSYFNVDVAIDQRPTLFPFLVSIVHSLVGYSVNNAFVLNLALLPVFLLLAYRLAKALGGETLGIIASLLVVAHPIVLISVRSAGFDFLAVFFSLLVLKTLHDFLRERAPAQLALLWIHLCLLAEVRYESALFFLPVVGGLLAFRTVTWALLRPFAWVYALTPTFVLPRIWQAMLRGNVPKQEPGTVTFSAQNFVSNLLEYLKPVLDPGGAYPAHSALVIALGLMGCGWWLHRLVLRVRTSRWRDSSAQFATIVALWMSLSAIIVFAYVWGRAQYPSAARLVLPIDVFLSFAAAWTLTRALGRLGRFVPILLAGALVLTQLPIASQARMMSRLTQTRESAVTWRFFDRLNEERILIVTDRPNHFTIKNYGAMSFESARRDRYLFTALSRRLFHDVYVIQHIRLSTGAPLPGYEIWPDRSLEPVLEFQNDADLLVRVSRVPR